MRYTVRMHIPGRMRAHVDGGALDRRDMLRLACQLKRIGGVRGVTTYPRIGDVAVAYDLEHGEASLRAIKRRLEEFEPTHPLKAPCHGQAGSSIDDLLVRAALKAGLSVIVPAPVRIAYKALDAERRARAHG